MEIEPAIVCLLIVAAMFVRLRWSPPVAPDLVFLTGLVAFIILGYVRVEDALAGFSSNTVFTLAGLLVVTAALERTGAVSDAATFLFRRARTHNGILTFLSVTVAPLSAFMNNTPVVDVFIKLLPSWCRRNAVRAGEVMLPVSYLAILGGLCTLIGTSTTLLISGLMVQQDLEPLGFFEIGRVGLPCTIIGLLYVFGPGRYILRKLQKDGAPTADDYREFIIEVQIEENAPAVGHLLSEWGRRPEFRILRVRSNKAMMTDPPPEFQLSAGTIITCVGSLESIVELLAERGTTPCTRGSSSEATKRDEFALILVTVSDTSPVLGQRIGESEFTALYGGEIVAASFTANTQIHSSAFVRLMPGEPILVFAPQSFVRRHASRSCFGNMSIIPGTTPRRHGRRTPAVILSMLLLLTLSSAGLIDASMPILASTSVPVILCAVLLISAGCIDTDDARSAVAIPLVVTIACSIGIGSALLSTGASELIASWLQQISPGNSPIGSMICLYVLAAFLTEIVSNAAVAAIFVPVAIGLAENHTCSPRPFIMAIAIAASASFLTPIGYQTNMMVQEPGGYQNRDYLVYGLPLTILVGACAVILIPLNWPF